MPELSVPWEEGMLPFIASFSPYYTKQVKAVQVSTWMDGRTQLNLLPSLLPNLCLLKFYPAFISEARSSDRVNLLAKIKPQGCIVAVLAFS